jgi:hypothetical protein
MTKLKTYCAVISLGLLTACGSSPRQAPVDDLTNPVGPPPDARIAPMQPSPSRSVETYPLADSADGAVPPGSSAAPRGQAQPANPAVVALLNDANQALQSDRPDRAAASIERALAIEPRNAWRASSPPRAAPSERPRSCRRGRPDQPRRRAATTPWLIPGRNWD